jgi:hypothetical protein
VRCADVTFEMRDEHYDEPWYENAAAGDLLWNPKGGEGHVLVEVVPCGQRIGRGRWPNARANCGCDGYFGPCKNGVSWLCECGEDNASRDHHYKLLARASS